MIRSWVYSGRIPLVLWGSIIFSVFIGGPFIFPILFTLAYSGYIGISLLWPYFILRQLAALSGCNINIFSSIHIGMFLCLSALIFLLVDLLLKANTDAGAFTENSDFLQTICVFVGASSGFYFLWSVSGYIVKAERMAANSQHSQYYTFWLLVNLPIGIFSIQRRLKKIAEKYSQDIVLGAQKTSDESL